MNILQYIFIGIIQGIVEWLPISSQGNVVIILINLFKIETVEAFNISLFLHIGTLFAATLYFKKDIKEIFLRKKENSKKDFMFLFWALFFTFLFGIPLYFFIKYKVLSLNLNYVSLVIGFFLIISGLLQLVKKNKKMVFSKPSLKNSFFLGLAQAFAILPGISRSGTTISVLLFEKFSVKDALRYSFLLSIPTILIGQIGIFFFDNVVFHPYILISLLFSFIFGYLTINLLMRFSQKVNFAYFCFILGGFYVLIFLFNILL